MHIVLYSPAWPPRGSSNGIVTYVATMRWALRDLGHRVTIVSHATNDGVGDGEGVIGLNRSRSAQLRVAASRFFGQDDWMLETGRDIGDTIAAVHARCHVDVVEMEESFGFAGTVAARLRIPVVVKLHGPAFLSLVGVDARTSESKVRIAREGAALPRVAAVISPARATLDQTVQYYSLALPLEEHIVNPIADRPEFSVWSSSACDADRILFVGRFDERKGGDIALSAFARIVELRPEVRLDFVGPAPGVRGLGGQLIGIDDYLRTLGSAVAQRVTVHGLLEPSAIAKLRCRAAMTVIPSRWENQGYTALEAMLQGCPIISSDAGGHREIFAGETVGLMADSGSVESLADAMDRLLADRELARRLGAAARNYVLDVHAPSRVVASTLDLYGRAIARAAALAPATGRLGQGNELTDDKATT